MQDIMNRAEMTPTAIINVVFFFNSLAHSVVHRKLSYAHSLSYPLEVKLIARFGMKTMVVSICMEEVGLIHSACSVSGEGFSYFVSL